MTVLVWLLIVVVVLLCAAALFVYVRRSRRSGSIVATPAGPRAGDRARRRRSSR